MQKIISKILIKLIGKNYLLDAIDIEKLNLKLKNSKIDKCLKQSSIGSYTAYYEEASVSNLQNDVSKIIIGKHTHIRGNLQIFGQGGNINIGDFCYVGENSKIWSASEIILGNQVLISHNVNIHDNISHPINSKMRFMDYKRIIKHEEFDVNIFDLKSKPIVIKDKAWVGFNSIILKGVTIGEGAIIGAGTLVTKDVPDWTIVAGNPAQIIREIPENER